MDELQVLYRSVCDVLERKATETKLSPIPQAPGPTETTPEPPVAPPAIAVHVPAAAPPASSAVVHAPAASRKRPCAAENVWRNEQRAAIHMLDVTWDAVPRTLRDALAPFVEQLRKPRDGKYPFDSQTGQELYRYVARQGGRHTKGGNGFVGQLWRDGRLTRICLAAHTVVAALVIVAALVDTRLHCQKIAHAWLHAMVTGGDAAATAWLAGCSLTEFAVTKSNGGRPSGSTVLRALD